MADDRCSLGSGTEAGATEAEHVSGIEGRGLPASWTYDGNKRVRNSMSRNQYEILVSMIHEGHRLRYSISNAKRDNVPFMIWLQEDYKEEKQQEWETEKRNKGYVDIAKETSRVILTNLSGRTRTVCLRGPDRNGCPNNQDTYYTIRPFQTDIMCFCTGLLIEEDLNLSMIEVIPFSDPNDMWKVVDVSHTLTKITTSGHHRCHILILDSHDKKTDPPTLWQLAITNLQGCNFRDNSIGDILPTTIDFKNVPRDILMGNMALSDMNTANGRYEVPRNGDRPWFMNNLGPFMVNVRGDFEPYVACRHRVGSGPGTVWRRYIDVKLEPVRYEWYYTYDEWDESTLQRPQPPDVVPGTPPPPPPHWLFPRHGAWHDLLRLQEDIEDLDLGPPLYSRPGGVIITIQPRV